MAFKGRGGGVIRGGIGVGGLGGAPRLPRLPGLASPSQKLAGPSMTSITGNKGLAHLDRAGIGAAELALGHKKL